MNTYLILYDLGGPETSKDYEELIKHIRSYGTRAKPLESFRFIKTSETLTTVRDKIEKYLDSNDKLVVINVTGDGWGTIKIPKETTDWMKNNI